MTPQQLQSYKKAVLFLLGHQQDVTGVQAAFEQAVTTHCPSCSCGLRQYRIRCGGEDATTVQMELSLQELSLLQRLSMRLWESPQGEGYVEVEET